MRAPHWLALGIPGQEAASRLPGSGTAAGGRKEISFIVYKATGVLLFQWQLGKSIIKELFFLPAHRSNCKVQFLKNAVHYELEKFCP